MLKISSMILIRCMFRMPNFGFTRFFNSSNADSKDTHRAIAKKLKSGILRNIFLTKT